MGKRKGNHPALGLCRNFPAGTSHAESSLPVGQRNICGFNCCIAHSTETFCSEEAVFFWHVPRKVDSQFAAR